MPIEERAIILLWGQGKSVKQIVQIMGRFNEGQVRRVLRADRDAINHNKGGV